MNWGYFWVKKFEGAWTKDLEQPFFQIKSALHLTANLTAYKSWMKNKNNNSCFVQVAQIKSFISSIFLLSFIQFYIDIISHKNVQFLLRRITPVNYRLRHVIEHGTIRSCFIFGDFQWDFSQWVQWTFAFNYFHKITKNCIMFYLHLVVLIFDFKFFY